MPRKRGFTLIELVVVIAVIAILAALLVPAVAGVIDDSRVSRTAGELRNIKDAANRYLGHCGAYPRPTQSSGRAWGSDEGFVNIGQVFATHTQAWKGPYLERWPERTAWGGVVGCGAVGAYYWHDVNPIGTPIDNDGKGAPHNDHYVHMNSACVYYPPGSSTKVDVALDDGVATTGVMRLTGASLENMYFLAGEGPRFQ